MNITSESEARVRKHTFKLRNLVRGELGWEPRCCIFVNIDQSILCCFFTAKPKLIQCSEITTNNMIDEFNSISSSTPYISKIEPNLPNFNSSNPKLKTTHRIINHICKNDEDESDEFSKAPNQLTEKEQEMRREKVICRERRRGFGGRRTQARPRRRVWRCKRCKRRRKQAASVSQQKLQPLILISHKLKVKSLIRRTPRLTRSL